MPTAENQVFKYMSPWVTFLIQTTALSKENVVWSNYGLRECDVDEVSVLRDGGIHRLFVDMSVVSRMVFGERSKLDTRFAPFHFLFYSTISPFFSPVPPSCLPILPCSVTPETEGRGSEIRNCTEQWPALWDPFSLAWGCGQPHSSDV